MTERPLTFADRVAAVDAVATASRIVMLGIAGPRSSIQASTIEIAAMAQRLVRLATLAEITFDMMAVADALQLERNPLRRRELSAGVTARISDVGAALEALGFGSPTDTTVHINPQEKAHG